MLILSIVNNKRKINAVSPVCYQITVQRHKVANVHYDFSTCTWRFCLKLMYSMTSLYLEVLSDANVLYDLSLYLEVRSKANVLYDLSLPGGSVWCWPAASPWGTPWSPPPTGSRRSLPASLNGQKNLKFSTFSFIPVPNLLLVCNYTFSNNIFTPTTPSIWNNVKILTLTNNNQGCFKKLEC